MLSVVTWKWKPPAHGYRSTFGPETVNVLRRMVARHYPHPHQFFCVTDDAEGIDPQVKIVPLWSDHAQLVSPAGRMNPSCYRRLKAYSREAKDIFGERLVSLDLDCVVTGDLSPLWNRPEDFVIWGDTNPTTPYNGSMWLLRTGTRTRVWDEFDPIKSPLLAKQKRYWGSDQAWIAACLGPHEARWGKADGVYSFRIHLKNLPKHDLPESAKVVFFHGNWDPWSKDVQRDYAWVREFWR